MPRKKLTAASLFVYLWLALTLNRKGAKEAKGETVGKENIQIVLRLNNQTPPRPDDARGSQRPVLRQR